MKTLQAMVVRPCIAALTAALIICVLSSHANSQNLIVNPGFENNPPPNFGNNIGWSIAPWIVGIGQQPNVVKVDGPSGTFNYGNLGPETDATAPGSKIPQHYLDIANGTNKFWQTFTVPACPAAPAGTQAKITFGGYFSGRGNAGGTATIQLVLGSGPIGPVVATLTAVVPAGNSKTDPWIHVSGPATLVYGSKFSYVVDMPDPMNFDNASLTIESNPCPPDGGTTPVIDGCLKDSKVAVKCNPDGTYTVTLSSAGSPGDVITMTSSTAGVTIAPPQQNWASTTTWTISGASPGQTVVLNVTSTTPGKGDAAGSDLCCSGTITIVMPDCPKPIDVAIGKEDTPATGGGREFNLWLTNIGAPITYAPGQLSVTENIPAGMTVTSIVAPGWTCSPASGVGPLQIHCTFNSGGTLATGAQLPNSIIVHYITTGPGPFKNCATVAVDAAVGVDNNPKNDTACVEVTPTDKKIDVAIAKTGGTTPVCRVGAYAFHITVTNGPNPWPGTGNIVVTDTVPANMTFAAIVSPPWSCLPAGPYAAGTTFTCTYNGPAPTANQVLPPINISATATIGPPFPPYTNCASVAVKASSGYVDTNPANNNACVTVAKPSSCSCPLPQVMNADGRCVCPPPMVTGATPNTCVCPQGTTLVDGKCVPVEICKPPLVFIPGVGCRCPDGGTLVDGKCVQVECKPPLIMIPGAGCRCPDGGVLMDGKCVKKIVCDRPLVPNADGTKCVCRDGLILRRGKCVEPEKPKREQTCKRGFVWNGETCVKRKTEPQEEKSRELPSIKLPLPGSNPRGGRDSPSPGTR